MRPTTFQDANRRERSVCINCGHPAQNHDGGECWTDSDGNEVFEGRHCDCWGFEQ